MPRRRLDPLTTLLAVLGLASLLRAEDPRPLVPKGSLRSVAKSRPRILITAADLPALRRSCRGEGKTLFEFMKRRCDGMLRMETRLDNNGRHYLPSFALLYLVTGERRYAQKTAEWLDLLADHTIENAWTCLEYIPVAAFAYDWIHDTLTPAQRERYAGGLVRQVRRIRKLWRHNDYNNHFALEHASELHVALALAHERHHRTEQAAWLAEGERWLKLNLIPAANEMSGTDPATAGGQAEGFGYNNWGYARPLSMLLAAWKSATGENLFSHCSLLRYDALWNIHGRRPDGALFRSEDCSSGLRWGDGDLARFLLIAREYQDGYARTAADSIQPRYPQTVWPAVISFDSSVAPRPIQKLPLARLFGPLGHVYTRSGWGPDAFFATFQCGDIFAGHQHLDNNAFTIFHRAPLAIDSGVNEYSGHRANYYSRTIAHNSIVVLDPSETFPGKVWSSQGTGGSNDGGQRRVSFPSRVTASAKDKAVRDVGEITHFENTPRYCYAVGDASKSYAGTKLKRFVRHFVHLRPDIIVIYDEVETTRPEFKTTWLLHCLDRPQRVESKTAVWRAGVLVKRYLPLDASVVAVGGPGREFLVGETNYPPDKKRDKEAGGWRIEVTDRTRSRTHRLLHLLVPPTRTLPDAKLAGDVLTIAGVARIDFSRRQVKALRK